jgi:tetratricopeptide (TPR) repeat protein
MRGFGVCIVWMGIIGSCGSLAQAAPPAVATTEAQSRNPPLEKVSDEKALEFGQELLKVIRQGPAQADRMDQLFDWSAMLERSAIGLNLDAAGKATFFEGFRKSMTRGKAGLFVKLHESIQNGDSYTITRVVQRTEGTRVRFRLVSTNSGMNFHEYLLREGPQGVQAVDLYISMLGEDLSGLCRRMLVLAQSNADRGFMDRLTGNEVAYFKHFKTIQKMISANQLKRYDDVRKAAQQLPAEVRNEKSCLILELTAATNSGNQRDLVDVIERFRAAHPQDPVIDIISIDYYAAKGNQKQALEHAKRVNEALEDDAHVVSLIADLLWQLKRYDEARKTIDRSIQMEPELLNAYWTKIAITVSQKDFAATRDTLQTIAKDFQIQIDLTAYESEPLFADFLKSKECEEFRQSQKGNEKTP